MAADQPQPHHRRSIRLQGYDYSQNGAYFITICTQGRECIFGHLINGVMVKTDIGNAVEKCWREIPAHFPNAQADVFIIMPNHIHGIIELHGDAKTGIPDQGVAIIGTEVGANHDSPLHTTRPRGTSRTIGSIIRGFKIGVAKQTGCLIWQRNFYEHIIRDEDEYRKITDYINSNPMNWESDQMYTGD